MGLLDTALRSQLARRESQDRLRRLSTVKPGTVDFSSNDYLSLSRDPGVRNAVIERLKAVGEGDAGSTKERMIGSGGSRLLDGNSDFAEGLERKIAAFHRSESALLFNSAFDANVGLLSCVPRAEDVILYDDLIHASVHDGMRLSRATRRIYFSHSSIVSNRESEPETEDSGTDLKVMRENMGLETTLKNLARENPEVRAGRSNVFVCVESLYSMDGDLVDLQKVCLAVETSLPGGNGYVIVDEAHSIGVLGDRGRGLVCQLGLQDRIWASVIGFGKAMGCSGGAILCSSTTRLYLINYARTLIYTTSMSFPSLASIDAVYDYIITGQAEGRRQHLEMLIKFCHTKLRDLNQRLRPPTAVLRVPQHISTSPIVPLFTRHPKCLALHCQHSAFMVRPIVAPTVPIGKERVRICLHAANTVDHIEKLCGVIETWVKSHMKADDIRKRQGVVVDDTYVTNSLLKEIKPQL